MNATNREAPGNAHTDAPVDANAGATQRALARVYGVRPHWHAVARARDAIGLPDFTLLHAGPPYANPCDPAPPVLSSAVLCCLYEKWATTEAHAEQLIASGEVKLVSAQSFGVVTPLAAVVSPSSTLVEVVDAHASPTARRAWSLLGSGAGPQLRFGSRHPHVLARLAWRDTVLAHHLAEALERVGPLDLFPLAAAGLAAGDDLHARTTSATAALRAQLSPFIAEPAVDTMLADTPLFFLTLWMAACHLMMSAATDPDGDAADTAGAASTLVVALAGNGREVGVRLAGKPSVWTTHPAAAPAGPRLDSVAAHLPAAPLTGDSGVIDAAGFGAHAFALAPEPATAFAAWLPAGWRDAQPTLLAGQHPAFDAALRCALDAAAVVQRSVEPLAAIAMIGADGRTGLIGRGVYAAPVALFEAALQAR
ncbi:oxamate carbamoyltransferase subunit AllG family protein [Paraburkholderia sp. 2C]